MKKTIAASVLSLLMLLSVGSANAEKISANANQVLTDGKVLHSSAQQGDDPHIFTVNYKKRVWMCKIWYSDNSHYSNICYANN